MTIQGGGPSYRFNCVLAAHPGAAAKGPWSVGSGLAWSPPGAGLLAARGSDADWVWTGVSSQLGFQEELLGAVDLSKCPPHAPARTPTPSELCEGAATSFGAWRPSFLACARCVEWPLGPLYSHLWNGMSEPATSEGLWEVGGEGCGYVHTDRKSHACAPLAERPGQSPILACALRPPGTKPQMLPVKYSWLGCSQKAVQDDGGSDPLRLQTLFPGWLWLHVPSQLHCGPASYLSSWDFLVPWPPCCSISPTPTSQHPPPLHLPTFPRRDSRSTPVPRPW